MRVRTILLASLAMMASAGVARAQEVTVKIGTVRSISTVSILWAVEKGYFKEFGIKVVNENLDTAANSIALLAQNQLQLVEGGISAGYFNALEKNLPVTMVLDRVSSPLGHNLMLRPDHQGKISDLKQLKGKTIATNGQGAVSTYEVGKMLESAGLTINDVDIKVLPFTQYALAFNNKAIDAAITIPPFTAQLPGRRPRRQLRRSGQAGEAATADHRGQHGQHRVRQGPPGADEELLRRLPEGHSRLLPGLPRGADQTGDDRHLDPHRHRDPRRAAAQISLAGAQPQRPDQCREPARHERLVRQEQDEQRAVSSRADCRSRVTSTMPSPSSGRSCWRTRTASSKAAGDTDTLFVGIVNRGRFSPHVPAQAGIQSLRQGIG